jgi:hypothetical protein
MLRQPELCEKVQKTYGFGKGSVLKVNVEITSDEELRIERRINFQEGGEFREEGGCE